MDTLDALEARSIFLIREAYAALPHVGMLWSAGKDSTVLLWLARKAFAGHVPFTLIHIDTSFKIPELIAYRDRLAAEWNLTLIYGQNRAALEARQTFPDSTMTRLQCCGLLKTDALAATVSGAGPRYRFQPATRAWEPDPDRTPFTGVIAGVRADEEGSRSKERYFSPRGAGHDWNVDDQPPELWSYFNTEVPPGGHVRVHPLLDWTELNIWEYIAQEQIPTVSLYYDQGEGRRYRSLGCTPCTSMVTSTARTPADIVEELRTGQFSRVAERSGRDQDREDGGGLETLRRGGYM